MDVSDAALAAARPDQLAAALARLGGVKADATGGRLACREGQHRLGSGQGTVARRLPRRRTGGGGGGGCGCCCPPKGAAALVSSQTLLTFGPSRHSAAGMPGRLQPSTVRAASQLGFAACSATVIVAAGHANSRGHARLSNSAQLTPPPPPGRAQRRRCLLSFPCLCAFRRPQRACDDISSTSAAKRRVN